MTGRAVGRRTRERAALKKPVFFTGVLLMLAGIALEAWSGFTPGTGAFAWGLFLLVVGGMVAFIPNLKALRG